MHDDATAELALGLTIASLRGIDVAVRETGTWRQDTRRRSLADSRVAILGYGSIGRAVAERMVACGAVVTGVASSPREDDLVGRVVTADEVDWAAQHVVVVVLPLSEATRHVVDAAFLARLSDDALVVNVGRGPLLDTDAVLAEAGRLRFALDVTDPEPLPDGHPLWTAPGVLVTPAHRRRHDGDAAADRRPGPRPARAPPRRPPAAQRRRPLSRRIQRTHVTWRSVAAHGESP